MKIQLNRPFTYQADPRTTVTLDPGKHTVTDHVGKLAIRYGGAIDLGVKKAPENKVAKVSANKAGVGRKTKRRGRTRSKPDAGSRKKSKSN